MAKGYTILNLSALNDRGEVAGTLESLKTYDASAFVFDGHTLISLGAPRGYGESIDFGITNAGTVLALAAATVYGGAERAYLAIPEATGYRWTTLPFDPLDGDCGPRIGPNGDIAGGTPKIRCAIWQRAANDTYSQPVRLAPNPGYQVVGLSSMWTSGSRFVIGGVQQHAGKPRSAPVFASIWSPKPSLQMGTESATLGLGGTSDNLLAIGSDTSTAVYWHVRFDTSGGAHLGALHELGLPYPHTWKNVYGTGITVDSSGTITAVGDGTQGSSNSPTQALVWRGTHPSTLQSDLPKGSGWSLSAADAINSEGDIIGAGVFDGQRSFFLMKPPTPISSDLSRPRIRR